MFQGNAVRRAAIALAAGVVVAGPLLGSATAWADTSTGSISGVVWFDRNSDHRQDNGEPGFGAAQVSVTDLADGTTSTITAGLVDGTFTISDLAPGVYQLSSPQTGYVSTTAPTVRVRVASGSQATAEFGVRGATIEGTTWHDLNSDGIRQPSEPGLAGVQLSVHESTLHYANGAASDANGIYRIQDLPAGSYQVSLSEPPAGYGLTQPGRDSVFDPTTGTGNTLVQVGAGQRAGHVDAGFVTASVDTAITAFTVPDQLHVGDQVSIGVDVANLSNVPERLFATVDFPAGFTPVSATADNGLAAGVFGQEAYLGSEVNPALPANTTVHLTVSATVTSALSDATISVGTPPYSGDTNPANNTVTQTVSTVG